MNAATRRRLERTFDGSATIEDLLQLERDAAADPAVAAALHATRRLAEACGALPEPPIERLDVEHLVASVRRELGASPTEADSQRGVHGRPSKAPQVPHSWLLSGTLLQRSWGVRGRRDGSWILWRRLQGVRRGVGASVRGGRVDRAPLPKQQQRRRAITLVSVAAAACVIAVVGVRTHTQRVGDGAQHPRPAFGDSAVGSASRSAVAFGNRSAEDLTSGAAVGSESSGGQMSVRSEEPLAADGDARILTAFDVVLPTVPLDVAARARALAVFVDELAVQSGGGAFDVTGVDGAAEFARCVEDAFHARISGDWPLAGFALELLGSSDPEGRRAAEAARYLGVRSDALTPSRLARALDGAPARNVFGAPSGEAVAHTLRLAAAQALVELGAYDELARGFEVLCASGAWDRLVGTWDLEARHRHLDAIARALPSDWRPASAASARGLVTLGRVGADRLAQLVLSLTASRSFARSAALPLGSRELLGVLRGSPFAREAVEDLVRAEQRPDSLRVAQLCELIVATEATGAIDWLDARIRRRDPVALEALVALPGTTPIAALLQLEGEGYVRDDGPWLRLLAVDHARVATHLARAMRSDVAEARSLVERFVALGRPELAPALACAVAARELDAATRERAALALAELPRDEAGGARATSTPGSDDSLRAGVVATLDAALVEAWLTDGDGPVAALVVALEAWATAEQLTECLTRLDPRVAERLQAAAQLAAGRPGAGTLSRQARVQRTLATTRVVAGSNGRGTRGTNLR